MRAALVQSVISAGQVTARIVVPAGTYVLTRPAGPAPDERNGDLDIAGPSNPNLRIEVAGAGAATTIIDAYEIDRVLKSAAHRTVSVSDLTLRNGFRPPSGLHGRGYREPRLAHAHALRGRSNVATATAGGIASLGR